MFRSLVRALNLVGISEVGHGWKPHKDAFSPLDPEAQLWEQGLITDKVFGEMFYHRVLNSIRVAEKSGKRILVREHTHSYFFQPDHELAFNDSPSWLADQLRAELGSFPRVLVSVRNPVDSWLGLQASFSRITKMSFDEYCFRYNELLDRAEVRSDDVYLFKYEDLVLSYQDVLLDIAKFLKCDVVDDSVYGHCKSRSSGNSGRQSRDLSIRERRPYSLAFYEEALASDEYRSLITRLDYPVLTKLGALGQDSPGLAVSVIKRYVLKMARRLGLDFKPTLERDE